MATGRPLSVWFNEEEIEVLKVKSKKEKRSLGNYIKNKLNLNEK